MLSTLAHLPTPSGVQGPSEKEKAMMDLASASASVIAATKNNGGHQIIQQGEIAENDDCAMSSVQSLEDDDSVGSMTSDNTEEEIIVENKEKIAASTIHSGSIPDVNSSIHICHASVASTTIISESMEISEQKDVLTDERRDGTEKSMESLSLPTHEEAVEIKYASPATSTTDAQNAEFTLPHGLRNLGNTCYLNSALQMLFSLENGFMEDLLHSIDDIHDNMGGKKEHDKKTQLRDALVEVGQKLRSKNLGESVLDPSAVKSAIDNHTPQFVGFRQHDSHEFLSSLLDILHEEIKVKEEKNIPDVDERSNNLNIIKSVSSDTFYRKKSIKKRRKKKSWNIFVPFSGKRCSSLSELDSDAISDLLHGDSPDEAPATKKSDFEDEPPTIDTPCTPSHSTWVSIVSSPPETHKQQSCTLAGGRAAVPTDCVLMSEEDSTDMPLIELKEEPRAEPGDEEEDVHMENTNNANNTTVTNEYNDRYTESSLVDAHFCSEIRVTLTCDSCCYSRSKTEMYRHLSIEVGSENDSPPASSSPSSASVEDGIRRFFAAEQREIKCEKCFCETATQTMKLIRLPNALLLHMKRFIVDFSPQTYNVSYRKNQTLVEYNEKLNISDYCAVDVSLPNNTSTIMNLNSVPMLSEDEEDDIFSTDCDEDSAKYALKSIVHHIGSSASCGHYTADVVDRNNEDDIKWYRCNDATVTSYKNDDEITKGKQFQKTAYMVMYELEL